MRAVVLCALMSCALCCPGIAGATLQVFGDIALRLHLVVPGIDIDFDIGLGVRYYF